MHHTGCANKWRSLANEIDWLPQWFNSTTVRLAIKSLSRILVGALLRNYLGQLVYIIVPRHQKA